MQTKEEFLRRLKQDLERNFYTRKSYIMGLIFHEESSYVIRLLKLYRRCVYLRPNRRKNIFKLIQWIYYSYLYKKYQFKYDTYISLDSDIGGGLWMPHLGGIIVNCISMGENCSVTKGVVIGNKVGQENRARIGNNCFFTLGSKVIGGISVGDNVIVAQNSVVIKDVENNTIVSGVPAKVIRKFNSIADVNI